MKTVITAALIASAAINACAEDSNPYRPQLHATVRAKCEYEPEIGKARFEVRNARLSVEGLLMPMVGYKAEADLCDEGKIRMLDAYVRVMPAPSLMLTLGQMRVPFSIDAHRSPHQQFFANRSFIAKQAGNVRDVGFAAAWTFCRRSPITIEGGISNGSGLSNQKNFWTADFNYSVKIQAALARRLNIALSCQRATAGSTPVMIYDAGAYWHHSRWHIEAEYLRKTYSKGAFAPVYAIDAFAAYRLPLANVLTAISFLARYDYLSDHSNGKETDGKLSVDDPLRHRLTGGVTLSLTRAPLQADIRINYEQYFYGRNASPSVSERSKLVIELVARF